MPSSRREHTQSQPCRFHGLQPPHQIQHAHGSYLKVSQPPHRYTRYWVLSLILQATYRGRMYHTIPFIRLLRWASHTICTPVNIYPTKHQRPLRTKRLHNTIYQPPQAVSSTTNKQAIIYSMTAVNFPFFFVCRTILTADGWRYRSSVRTRRNARERATRSFYEYS